MWYTYKDKAPRNKKRLKAARQEVANSWARSAQIPQVAKICRWLTMDEPLNADLQAFANSHIVDVRKALGFLGIGFEVIETPTGVIFKKSNRPAGSRQNAVLRICQKMRPDDSPEGPHVHKVKGTGPVYSSVSFYKTDVWVHLRYDALVASNGCCKCCGSSARDGAVLRVDHIKPIRTHPHLRAEPTNLQVLCNLCNWGKGSRDETDWR